jgi:hypothetical protein
MKGDVTVQTAVKSASRVSKRKGKWANLPEIKNKAPTFKEPMSPVLSYLVRNHRIEKKSGLALWRPRSGGIGGDKGKSTGRGTEGGRNGGDSVGRSVARGVASGAVSNSITRSLF